MGKNIVLCLDGTWDGPGSTDRDGDSVPSNVQKIFESLDGSGPLGPTDNEKEIAFPVGLGPPAQVAKYIHGIGDATNALAKVVAGAIGLGLIARIVRGYTYLSRSYTPGDRIYIVGFSRGAYTARALAGFVAGQGLLDWNAMQLVAGSEASYSAGLAAWQQYKQSLHSGASGIWHALASAITNLYDRFELGLHPPPPLQFLSEVNIKTVGVWDTVGALGIPDIKDESGNSVRLDAFQFVDQDLSEKVEFGFHALAVDEQRVDYTPSIWNARDGVTQVLFPGAHADVGGGYPPNQSGLANGALVWMAARLGSTGVMFAGMPPGLPNPLDVAHRPWDGALPRLVTGPRQFPPTLLLSQRVVQRLLGGDVPQENLPPAPYRPINLLNS